MRRFIPWVMATAVAALWTLGGGGVAHAAADGYIDIASGEVLTHQGKSIRVDVDFGNAGDEVLENVGVICFWGASLGTRGDIDPGPFDTVDDSVPDAVAGGASVYGMILDDVDVKPGKSYNFRFDIDITAADGWSDEIVCMLGSAASVPGGGELVAVDVVGVEVEFGAAACEDGGWESLTRFDGTAFPSQGACMRYVNTNK